MTMSAEVSATFVGDPRKEGLITDIWRGGSPQSWVNTAEHMLYANKFPLICDTVDVGETLTIPSTFQYIVSGALTNNGTIINNGKVVLI